MNRLFLLLALLTSLLSATVQAAEPTRAITQVSGDLYRFQNNFHYSVFLVGSDSILVTDPIDADAAAWLKAELNQRFNLPIRYLVYSHDHRDHIAGGELFADEAIVIAHRNAYQDIVAEKRPTATPELTFTDRMTLRFGGKEVELIYLGPNHSDGSIVIRFPQEKALFVVDFISVKRLPYRDLSDAYFPEWIESVRAVEGLEFDTLVPGHGPLGTKADVAEHRRYLQALYDAVLAAARAGLSVEEMKQQIKLEEFQHLGQYADWLPLNIEGMARQIALHRRGN